MAPSAILELVDGEKDIRFQMTALTLAKERREGREEPRMMTARNIEKVTRFRKDGKKALESLVGSFGGLEVKERDNSTNEEKRWGGRI